MVVVVILNWNSWQRTIRCVQDAAAIEYPNLNVLVVDNDSSDGSEQEIRLVLPHVQVIQSGANLGYAGGNNVGIRAAMALGADYVLILNPDVRLQGHALSTMVQRCSLDNRLAALCPVVRWSDGTDRVWFGGATISWHRASATHRYVAPATSGVIPSAWATGCCLLLNVCALDQVGLFDPDYFLYWEEIDLCQRLLERGFSVGVASDAVAYHDVSHSIGVDSPSGWYYFVRNGLFFFSQHAPRHHVPRSLVVGILCGKLALAGSAKAALLRDGTARARLLGAFDFLRARRGPSPRFSPS